MLAALTVRGLALLRHGSSAPLWHLIVTQENSLWLNLASALIVAFCFAYTVRKLAFRGRKSSGRPAGPWEKLVFAFACVPFFVIPGLAEEIATLSPFYFSLMPSALSFALMASKVTGHEGSLRSFDAEDVVHVRLLNVRLLLSGVFAAIGAWEGVLGVGLAIVVLFLAFRKRIRLAQTTSVVLLLWVLGFALGFIVEGACLDWPWSAIRPLRPPFIGMVVFLFVGVLPVALVRVFGARWWLMLVWGLALAVMTVNVLVAGKYWRDGAAERFVRKTLADLGDRKIIIGDGLTDDLFRELKPSDVRLVSMRALKDREFLLKCFDDKEPVSKRALVVRHYYYLPETEEMMAELGYRWTSPAEPKKETKMPPKATNEIVRVQRAVSDLNRALAAAHPIMKSIKEMMEDFEKIPPRKRKAKIEEARANIRRGWSSGLEGTGLSSTVLSLDIMLGDWEGAESDALTALVFDREDAAANSMLGNLRLRAKQYEEAEKYLRKGAKGGGSGTYNDLAMLLLETGRAKEAADWARKAVAKAPNDWNTHETLVQVLIALQEPVEAQKELAEVERLAKEQKQYDLIKEMVRRDRTEIMRQRGRFANEQWGQDKSDLWGE